MSRNRPSDTNLLRRASDGSHPRHHSLRRGTLRFILESRIEPIVCPSPLSMERHPRLTAEALEKRISSLANGDLFRPVGRENEGPGRVEICMVLAQGIIELPVLDRPGAARSPKAIVGAVDSDPWTVHFSYQSCVRLSGVFEECDFCSPLCVELVSFCAL